jgi:hypothetical protein
MGCQNLGILLGTWRVIGHPDHLLIFGGVSFYPFHLPFSNSALYPHGGARVYEGGPSFFELGVPHATRVVLAAHLPLRVAPVRPREGHFAHLCLISLPHAPVRRDYDSRYI